jgi:hypothetical protein
MGSSTLGTISNLPPLILVFGQRLNCLGTAGSVFLREERDLAQIARKMTQAAEVTPKTYPNDPLEAEVVRIGVQAGAPAGDGATFPVVLALNETGLRTGGLFVVRYGARRSSALTPAGACGGRRPSPPGHGQSAPGSQIPGAPTRCLRSDIPNYPKQGPFFPKNTLALPP